MPFFKIGRYFISKMKRGVKRRKLIEKTESVGLCKPGMALWRFQMLSDPTVFERSECCQAQLD